MKLGKTMIRENLHALIQGEMVGKSKGSCTYCKNERLIVIIQNFIIICVNCVCVREPAKLLRI